MKLPQSFNCGDSSDQNMDAEHEKKQSMLLTLPKADIFVADQTPTPTGLIRNCEEVGLFDDLQHVNPFEETFRRAVEQKVGQTTSTITTPTESHTQDDTLHTPQVFPQLEEEIVESGFRSDDLLQKPLGSPSALDVHVIDDLMASTEPVVSATSVTRQISLCDAKLLKNRKNIVISSTEVAATTTSALPHNFSSISPAITLIQPQIITLSFPATNSNESGVPRNNRSSPISTAIPVQTVKPFILPKPTATCTGVQQATVFNTSNSNNFCTTTTYTHSNAEPSSASLTPTSQLPIKERLKAILSQGTKSCSVPLTTTSRCSKRRDAKSQLKYSDNNIVERRRAAATRYRHKMRNEHKEMQQHNAELKAENMRLRERIRQLEFKLTEIMKADVPGQPKANGTVPAQVQIPASTLHLIMNIPQMVVSNASPPTLQNPITYRLEKK